MTSATHSKNEITAMLRAWGAGEQEATDDLIRAVYTELRRQARFRLKRERANHTLDTTALINEVYLRLVGQRSTAWKDRGHFFAIASKLMRRILVDHARSRHSRKRGGVDEDVRLSDITPVAEPAAANTLDIDILALDEALERLALIDPQQVRIVELRHFGGLEVTETAAALNISAATVKRDWAMAKAWLRNELRQGT